MQHSTMTVKRQPGIDGPAVPGLPDPCVIRVVAGEPAPLARAGHYIEVVHVVAGRGHRRSMPAVRDQDDVARAHLGEDVNRPFRGPVDPLIAEAGSAGTGSELEGVNLPEPPLPCPVFVGLGRPGGRPRGTP